MGETPHSLRRGDSLSIGFQGALKPHRHSDFFLQVRMHIAIYRYITVWAFFMQTPVLCDPVARSRRANWLKAGRRRQHALQHHYLARRGMSLDFYYLSILLICFDIPLAPLALSYL